MIQTNRLISNPFILYASAWLIVIPLYTLGWSEKYPQLSYSLFIFLMTTSLFSLFSALITHKKRLFTYRPLTHAEKYYKWTKRQTVRVYILLITEFIIEGNIPFWEYILGRAKESSYMEYGVPFIHVLVLNGLIFLFYFASYCYLSIGTLKNKFLFLMFLNFIGPLTFMSRGSIMYMLFGYFLLYLMAKKSIIKTFKILIPSSIIILYLFGLMGNMRTNDYEGFWIKHWGGASEKFEQTRIPSEFFWSYLYVTSPLGNLQTAIDLHRDKNASYTGFIPLVVNEVVPMFISKRIGIPRPRTEPYRVDPTQTVGSLYFKPYLVYGWLGMIIVYLALMGYIWFFTTKISKNCIFRVPMYIILCNMSFFCLFDNMLIYMGLFPQLIFIYLLKKKNILDSNALK